MNETLTYNQFYKHLQTDELSNCYFFEGEEEWVKRSALFDLTQKATGDQFSQMNTSVLIDPSPDELIASSETLPLLSEKRVVIIRQSALLENIKTKEYDVNEATEQVMDYLTHLPASVCLIFYAGGKADARRKLYKQLSKSSVHVNFSPLDEPSLIRWITRECGHENMSISAAACSQLITMCGHSLFALHSEIQKLCAFCLDKGNIEPNDVLACCHANSEYSVFLLTNALFAGDGKAAFQLLNSLLQNGEQRIALLALIAGQCRRTASMLQLLETGKSEAEIARILEIKPFAVRESLKYAKRISSRQMRCLSFLCLQTEYRIKCGDINENGALEYVMIQILAAWKGEKVLADY